MTDLEEAPTRRRRPRLTVPDGECNDDLSNNHREETDEVKAQRRKQHRRKNKRRSRDLEQPFHVLFLQVGATLFLLCSVSFYLYRTFVPPSPITEIDAEGAIDAYTDDDDNLNVEEIEAAAAEAVVPTQAPTKPTAPPLPVWELGKATTYDAFGIAEFYHSSKGLNNHGSIINKDFWDTAARLRTEFADLYGGENAVRAMMERGMTFFPVNTTDLQEEQNPPSDLVATACRIKQAKDEGRPFKFTFGGYSVTVGRGNYFHQSFPFVMERILEEPFKSLGVDLSVKNAAIGG